MEIQHPYEFEPTLDPQQPMKHKPWGSKDHKINSLLEKTIILVGIYNK